MSKTIIGNLQRAVVVRDNQDATKITVKEVKNLGWLLHHWDEVTDFIVTEPPDGVNKDWDCILRANLKDGRYYACSFADRGVLQSWLRRPVFYGRPINWFGINVVIAKQKL